MIKSNHFFIRKNLPVRSFLHTFLAIIVVSFTKGATIASPTYDEGIDYKRIYSENKFKKTKKIEVIEFFGLFCPHCRNFSPVIQKWAEKLPADVEFKKLHVPFREISHQRLYFTLKKMGLIDQYLGKLFADIQDKRLPLKEYLSITIWVEDNGLSLADFEKEWNSNEVKNDMKEASSLMKLFKISGVPQIIVDGEFLTSPAMVGSNRRIISLLDYLIAERSQ
ncbi:thiol:disulfide interchange protein DsbA/DsbL [Betaproteobacteria bacterium]|nr:thiol:disulfide interchange protein DsbA/DsbL [Betaproteobacteria bacterium]